MIEPAVAALIGTLITTIGAIVVAWIQNNNAKPQQISGILLPEKVILHRPKRYGRLLIFFAFTGAILGYVFGVVNNSNKVNPSPIILPTRTTNSRLTETPVVSSTPLLSENLTTPTVYAAIPSTTPIPNVYIADWTGVTSYDSLILFVASCKDNDNVSNILGKKPMYWVIYQTWIGLTFVDSQDTPNGIVKIEQIYNNDFARHRDLRTWYITMYEASNLDNQVSPPVELPPKTPKQWYFRAVHVVETQPEIAVTSLLDYGKTLSPINWTFTIVNQEQVIHTSDLFVAAPEAISSGKMLFSKNCKELIPEWPYLPIPGRQLSK